MRIRRWIGFLVVVALCGGSLAALPAMADGDEVTPLERAPWRRRRRANTRPSRRATTLVTPEDWPTEPGSPGTVDPERFAVALRQLCGWMPPSRPARWTGYILSAAEEFDIDPFLLAGLAHRMGRCNADSEHVGGLGLTSIPRTMYGDFLRRGTYTYSVPSGDGFEERTLDVSRFPFSEHQLRRAEPNLYFAAAILRVWREQHEMLPRFWQQHPHRHFVSHFIWGDRVRSDRGEDRILTDRRRMLQYYGVLAVPPPIRRHGLDFGTPLDGAPRVISSWIGAEREGGARRHRGVDVESVLGEPVRAVASGRVNFAGVDLPGHRSSRGHLTPDEIEAVPRHTLGSGGRYVCVLHHPEQTEGGEEPAWLRTCYMHLEDVNVRHGDEVERGALLGTVGRTGMLRSAPHLHLELHGPDGLMDASVELNGLLMGHQPED